MAGKKAAAPVSDEKTAPQFRHKASGVVYTLLQAPDDSGVLLQNAEDPEQVEGYTVEGFEKHFDAV
jgi:hypothetical protein